MRADVWLWILTLSVLGSVACAQPDRVSPEVPVVSGHVEVVERVGNALKQRAYVTGVDFSRWAEIAAKHKDAFEKAETPERLIRAVNRALAEFRVSHLRLTRTTGQGGEASSMSGRAGARHSGENRGGARVRVDDNETLDWLTPDLVTLRIRSFDQGRYDGKRLETLMAACKDASAMVVDLRNNGGGAVQNLSHALSLFIKAGTPVGVYVTRSQAERFESDKGKKPEDAAEVADWSSRKFTTRRAKIPVFPGKVAVLMNRGSASASEIFAAALRDHRNAPLVGQRSAGAVLMATKVRLVSGFELYLPTADYVTQRNVRLEGNPLEPHLEIPRARGGQPDQGPGQAFDLLRCGL